LKKLKREINSKTLKRLPDEWVDEDDSSAAPKEKQIAIEVSSLSQNQRRYPLRNVLDVITQRSFFFLSNSISNKTIAFLSDPRNGRA